MGQVVALRRRTSPTSPSFSAYQPMGALGLAPTGAAVASKAGSVAAGYSVAQLAALGSAAGPIGTVVGAIVGLALSALLTKNYLNVAQANAGEDQAVQAFNQYKAIAGQIPGRQIGVTGMTAIFDGAVYSGVFPLNNQVKTFHEGALKYPGNPDWVWGVMNDGANNPYTFAWALQQLKLARTAVSTASSTFSAGGGRGGMLRGLGAASGATPIPEAITLVDQYFIPSNRNDSPAWAIPSSALAHQLLYDAADAYLAANAGFTTTPFVASQWNATQVNAIAGPSQLLPAASSTATPGVVPTSASSGGVPTASGSPLMMTTQPVTGPTLNPIATPQLSPNTYAVPPGSNATTVAAATSANLDSALAAQGYVRVGTTSNGFPLYSNAGQVYAYQNGSLYPFGSVAQLAATGNAGTGLSVPGTGLDPNTLAAIQAAVSSGISPLVAAQGAAANLQAQGVPITPTVQDQLNQAAQGASIQGAGMSSGTILLIVAGIVGVVLLAKK